MKGWDFVVKKKITLQYSSVVSAYGGLSSDRVFLTKWWWKPIASCKGCHSTHTTVEDFLWALIQKPLCPWGYCLVSSAAPTVYLLTSFHVLTYILRLLSPNSPIHFLSATNCRLTRSFHIHGLEFPLKYCVCYLWSLYQFYNSLVPYLGFCVPMIWLWC